MGSALAGTVVLVADDHSDRLEILTYLVSAEGGIVRSARTAREVLELLLTLTPDLMLLDISMPDIDGYELLATIRGIDRLRDVPAVAVTAHAYQDDKRRCAEAGFAEHIGKPYDPGALMDVVARLVVPKSGTVPKR